MTMTLLMPPDLQAFIQQELARGAYQSEEEVVCEGLRLLQEHKRRREALIRDLQVGIQQLERGEGIHISDENALRAFFDDIEARGTQRLRERQQAAL